MGFLETSQDNRGVIPISRRMGDTAGLALVRLFRSIGRDSVTFWGFQIVLAVFLAGSAFSVSLSLSLSLFLFVFLFFLFFFASLLFFSFLFWFFFSLFPLGFVFNFCRLSLVRAFSRYVFMGLFCVGLVLLRAFFSETLLPLRCFWQ